MLAIDKMRNMIQAGQVYEYKDFEPVSKDYKRNTAILIKEGVLVRVHAGIFYAPRQTVFGDSGPPEHEFIQRFLNDDHFVIYALDHFNTLGLGTTQLYNKVMVFNRKRHGVFNLYNRKFHFHRWREAPQKLTKEFLLAEMFNRFKELSEDKEMVVKNLKKKINDFDLPILQDCLQKYGKISVQKEFAVLFEETSELSSK